MMLVLTPRDRVLEILGEVWPQRRYAFDIAREMESTVQLVTGQLRRLERIGFVERQPGSSAGWRWRVTARGYLAYRDMVEDTISLVSKTRPTDRL